MVKMIWIKSHLAILFLNGLDGINGMYKEKLTGQFPVKYG